MLILNNFFILHNSTNFSTGSFFVIKYYSRDQKIFFYFHPLTFQKNPRNPQRVSIFSLQSPFSFQRTWNPNGHSKGKKTQELTQILKIPIWFLALAAGQLRHSPSRHACSLLSVEGDCICGRPAKATKFCLFWPQFVFSEWVYIWVGPLLNNWRKFTIHYKVTFWTNWNKQKYKIDKSTLISTKKSRIICRRAHIKIQKFRNENAKNDKSGTTQSSLQIHPTTR